MQISTLPSLRILLVFIPLILLCDHLAFWGVFSFLIFGILLCFVIARNWKLPLVFSFLILIFFSRLSINEECDFPRNTYLVKKVLKTKKGNQSLLLSGHNSVLANVKLNNKQPFLFSGDIISINKSLSPIQAPLTLNGFNYSKYLLDKGVEYVVDVKSAELDLVVRDSLSAYYFAQKIKYWLIQKIMSYKEVRLGVRGVLTALLLGDKSNLLKEDKSLFRETGVVHVLAISGLHVGVFYLTLSFLFVKILRFRNLLSVIVIVFLLFGYAFITGLSPSVVRATIMFSLIQLGKGFNKEVSTLNIVFFTGALMLFWDPTLIYNVGFQLSFSAVIGIVITVNHSFLSGLVANKYLSWFWTLLLVNLSAFLFTAPVLSYHFGVVNLTSLWSSFMVVPLISVAMYIAMFVIGTSFYPIVSVPLLKMFVWLYDWIIKLLGFINEFIHLEFKVRFEELIVFGFFSFLVAASLRKFHFLWLSLAFILMSLICPKRKNVEVLKKPTQFELKIDDEFFVLKSADHLLFEDLSISLNENYLLISRNGHSTDTLDFNVNKYQYFEVEN